MASSLLKYLKTLQVIIEISLNLYTVIKVPLDLVLVSNLG